jgi:hypothetical protein
MANGIQTHLQAVRHWDIGQLFSLSDLLFDLLAVLTAVALISGSLWLAYFRDLPGNDAVLRCGQSAVIAADRMQQNRGDA